MPANRKSMHPDTRAAWDAAEKAANMRVVIVQTLGNAPDSAGFHAADGRYQDENGHWVDYCAAVDFSVNQGFLRISDGQHMAMDADHIKHFLDHLAAEGFVGWWRRVTQGFSAQHGHCVFAGCKMKPGLQSQVKDFLNDRTGLKGHAHETFYTADAAKDAKIRAMFEAHN